MAHVERGYRKHRQGAEVVKGVYDEFFVILRYAMFLGPTLRFEFSN